MVNTVLGKIQANDLGISLCHEHIFVGAGELAKAFGDRYCNKDKLIELAVKQITEAKEKYGLTTFIDGTTPDLGRDVELLVQVSKKSGVHIIATTGFYYDDHSYIYGMNPTELAKYFIHECKYGMENTYKTKNPILPGMLKCATDSPGITEINKIALTTMAITQRETLLPLFTHNNHIAKTALEQLRILEKEGADLSKVIVGHISDTSDIEYIEEILKQNVFVGFDRIFCTEEQADVLCKLLDKGYGDKILLSRDGGTFTAFGDNTFEDAIKNEENTFTTVLGRFLAMLTDRGVSEIEIDKMLRVNIEKLMK